MLGNELQRVFVGSKPPGAKSAFFIHQRTLQKRQQIFYSQGFEHDDSGSG